MGWRKGEQPWLATGADRVQFLACDPKKKVARSETILSGGINNSYWRILGRASGVEKKKKKKKKKLFLLALRALLLPANS